MFSLYCDFENIGKRALLQTDSGRGRSNPIVISTAKLYGLGIYPGVPNTSEGTQEMDQLFGYFKKLDKAIPV